MYIVDHKTGACHLVTEQLIVHLMKLSLKVSPVGGRIVIEGENCRFEISGKLFVLWIPSKVQGSIQIEQIKRICNSYKLKVGTIVSGTGNLEETVGTLIMNNC